MISSIFKRYFTSTRMVSQQSIDKVNKLIQAHPIFIASKATKKTVGDITKEAYVIELDEESDGAELQEALFELTKQRTVPNVFIGGKHVGGNSDVQALNSAGELGQKIKAAL